MIWLTWRQLRVQTIAVAALLVALGAVLLLTGFGLGSQETSSGLSACHGAAACHTAASSFLSLVNGTVYPIVFDVGIALAYVVPGLIGMFWGAPLIAREIETGTFRLAWNQSVSRTRWVLVKLGLIGLAAMATAGVLGWVTSWWASPFYRAHAFSNGIGTGTGRIAPLAFGAQGVAPLGYAAFAFALGVTAGLLIRRTIPAMVITLAVFAFVQVAWPNWVRPDLITPVSYTKPLSIGRLDEVMVSNGSGMTVRDSATKPGAWIISNVSVKPNGQVFTGPATKACTGQGMRACDASITRLHLHQVVTYQPASRFWELQWVETAIFLALAAALAGFCAWWVRRRQLT
jgi:ABC-type transport system involved in multi-copper enzyme maturation permease subunit